MSGSTKALQTSINLLHDAKQCVAVRTRSIFSLKADGTESAIRALEHSLQTDASALIRHEVAYVLGQMCAVSSLPTLQSVLQNGNEDVMVRHEAAEAMGAIGDSAVIPLLLRYARDADVAREISETCVLAVARIRHVAGGGKGGGEYCSVDPAPPADSGDVNEWGETLCNEDGDMFARYRAMFALRDRGGKEAVLALCKGMHRETKSALFRHEVAYVLGQMRDEAAVDALGQTLKKNGEHEMVRHEAAEALGSIATPKAMAILHMYRTEPSDVVRESVEVALDISDYNNSYELHYAQKAS